MKTNRALGATGATSNPIIISDLIKTGRYDDELDELLHETKLSDDEAAWQLTDRVVRSAQEVFLPVWKSTKGDDGYVSFELDPLLEDPACTLSHERARRLATSSWARTGATGHQNRMIKVPATPAGIDALEELCAAGVTLNVTLIFTMRQYEAARDAIWRGAQRRKSLDGFKSVYSIFVSRVDVYTEKARARACRRPRRASRHRQREATVAGESEVLVHAADAAAAGNHLRQHGHEEAGRSAVEVRRRAGRQRHSNESAGDERSGAKERPHVSAARSTRCRRPRCWRRSMPKWTCRSWKSS